MKTKWTAVNIPSQSGRRALITGANSGIGFETALELARHGAEIVLPARTQAKADEAAGRIRAAVPGAVVTTAVLDLSSQASVHAFAAWFSASYPGPSLDLLINNAGVMAIPQRELTEDGFERQFATNFLGPFVLTALLYPHVKQTPGSRIIIVSSSITKFASLDFDNLQSELRYSAMNQAYGQSKLADSIFAAELQRRIALHSSPMVVAAAHPGYAVTNLQTSGPGKQGSTLLRIGMTILKPILSQDAAHGALPTLYAATAPDVQPYGYYGPDGLFEMKGYPTAVRVAKDSDCPTTGVKLWAAAEQLVGMDFRP